MRDYIKELLEQKGIKISRNEGDSRIVHGAGCCWWDSITKSSKNGELPCCPHCGSILFETDNIDEWYKQVDEYNKTVSYDYKVFIDWLRGKCFKTLEEAIKVWERTRSEGERP